LAKKQITNQFTPTATQKEALKLLTSSTPNILLYGSSRSGKSIAICYYLMQLALNVANVRIGIFRRTAVSCRATLFDLSWPETLNLAFPDLVSADDLLRINRTDMTIEFSNGSKILFGGLDDNDRVEKILGQSLHTAWLNEATDLSYDIYSKLITRLSGKAITKSGKAISQKIICDCNPTTKRHWLYRLFVENLNPVSRKPVADIADYAVMKLATADNLENLPASYLKNLENLKPSDRVRFLSGDWSDEVDNPLFLQADIDANRVRKPISRDDLTRIVVAVDPAISANEGSDETGIVVAGIDTQGHGYVLEDLTVKGSPDRWASIAVDAYRRWMADAIVAESNQGGSMVESVIRGADQSANVKLVHASKGKVIRAEPVSALYAKGLVHHPCDGLPDLEDQMVRFNLSYNRSRDGSPDRLDALVWALSELLVEEQWQPSKVTVGRLRMR